MTVEKYTIIVAGSVVFVTESERDAELVLNSLQKIQELTYGLNGYTFDVEITKRQATTPNYSRERGYLNKNRNNGFN